MDNEKLLEAVERYRVQRDTLIAVRQQLEAFQARANADYDTLQKDYEEAAGEVQEAGKAIFAALGLGQTDRDNHGGPEVLET